MFKGTCVEWDVLQHDLVGQTRTYIDSTRNHLFPHTTISFHTILFLLQQISQVGGLDNLVWQVPILPLDQPATLQLSISSYFLTEVFRHSRLAAYLQV